VNRQAQKDLAAAIASGTAAIEKLEGELRNSIKDLKAERAREEDARSTQITTCEEDMKALLDSQGNVISAITSEIGQLQQQKKDAEDNLEKIKGDHGVVTAPEGQATTSEDTTTPEDKATTPAPEDNATTASTGHCVTKPTLCEKASEDECKSDTYLAVWSTDGTEASKMCSWSGTACETKPTLCEKADMDQCNSDTYLAVWSTAGTEASKMCKWVEGAEGSSSTMSGDGDGGAETSAGDGEGF